MAPFFDNFSLRPDPLNPEKIRLEWKHTGSDIYFSAYHLSDGVLRFICLVSFLLQPELPTTILIDEPEPGLHPHAIVVLAALLQKAATRSQIIVSTRSVSLVNQFQPENRTYPRYTDNKSDKKWPEFQGWDYRIRKSTKRSFEASRGYECNGCDNHV